MSERSEQTEQAESTDETTQLRLLPNRERRPEWSLDERTRRAGRRGVAEARAILRRAQPPAPKQPVPVRKAS
jgi:hypothetical protein